MVTVLTIISPNEEETLKQCPEITESPNSVVVNYKKDENSDSYERARIQIFDAIKSNQDVFIYGDTWNSTDRLDLLSYIRVYTKDIKSITLVAPYEEKMMTDKNLKRNTKKLQLPLLGERFTSTEIRHITPKQESNLLMTLIKRATIFESGKADVDESLQDHLFRTAWHASDNFGPGENAESIAGLYHDYGKMFSEKEIRDGRTHYLCANAFSTYIFLSLIPTLQEQYGKDRKTLEKAAKLINYLPDATLLCTYGQNSALGRRLEADDLYKSLIILNEANLQTPTQVITK